jgi:hypothetical protein
MKMKTRAIHENLDTSFVNLSALLRYLRRRQFIGLVKIELNGYEAEITLSEESQMKVREFDRLAGRVSEGDEALQRLLIRAREAGGTIHVYQIIHEAEEITETPIKVLPNTNGNYQNGNYQNGNHQNGNFANQINSFSKNGFNDSDDLLTLPSGPLQKTFADKAKEIFDQPKQKDFIEQPKPNSEQPKPIETKPQTNLPNFPFDLSNNVENKAKQTQISKQDWQVLIQVTSELLYSVDKNLANASLNFSAALRKAQAEISDDYPFLNVQSGVFVYLSGKISMQEQVNHKLYVASLNEILRRMLDKLASNPKFAECHRQTVQGILALIRQRKNYYEKFSITPQLEKILGV